MVIVISGLCCDLSWLTSMPHHFQCYTGNSPLVSIYLCLVLSPSSSSSCTRILLSSFLSPGLFSTCSLIVLFLYGHAVSTVLIVWPNNCHHFFFIFLIAHYVPNVAKRSIWHQYKKYKYIDDWPTTDDRPLISKNSNGDISAMGHPIHLINQSINQLKT